MEQAISDVCKHIRIGKILIQTNQLTDEPEVTTIHLLVAKFLKLFCLFFSCITLGCRKT